MKKKMIRLSTINDVKSFVNICTGCGFDIDLSSGRYTVNAKSIMGIFSLDLGKPITLEVMQEGPEVEAFFKEIGGFSAEVEVSNG
jgi:phosphotransferase system HPr-like phosphotransfer protein